jgi:hypothetical protein
VKAYALQHLTYSFNIQRPCWTSLCDESSDPSDLFFKILFAEAARCAGVDTSFIPECVLADVFDVIFNSDDTGVARVRRSLAKESQSSTCEQPTDAELSYFVSFLLMEAEQSCTANNSNSDADLDSIFKALVSIFGASDCWGVTECGDDAITDDWMTPVVQMDGTFCNLGLVNASSTRTIDLSYYYLMETASTSEEDAVSSIEAIEQAFVTYVCSWERRRSLEDAALSFEIDILAVDSNPLDTISSKCKCARIRMPTLSSSAHIISPLSFFRLLQAHCFWC